MPFYTLKLISINGPYFAPTSSGPIWILRRAGRTCRETRGWQRGVRAEHRIRHQPSLCGLIEDGERTGKGHWHGLQPQVPARQVGSSWNWASKRRIPGWRTTQRRLGDQEHEPELMPAIAVHRIKRNSRLSSIAHYGVSICLIQTRLFATAFELLQSMRQ